MKKNICIILTAVLLLSVSTCVDDEQSNKQTDTETGKTATVSSVSVSPADARVNKGATRQFSATVTGTNSPAQTVTWTVTGGVTGTTISTAGLLTVSANETTTSLKVKATSTIDTTKFGEATVTIGDIVEPTDNRIKDPATTNTQLSNPSWSPITSNHGGGNKWLVQQTHQLGYETWDEDTQGTASFRWYGQNQGGGAAFRAEWGVESDPAKRPLDFLARVGYFWNESKAHTAYGNIYCGFNFERSGRYRGSFSYIGIYGWSKNPLVEYYVVEDTYGNAWRDETAYIQNIQETILSDIDAADRDKPEYYKGTYTLDDGTYKVYRKSRTGPSIEGSGNSDFTQFFSVRQTPRKSGTISVTEHFKKWDELGMKLGTNMYECKFKVEVGGRPEGNGGAYSGFFDARLIQFYRANDNGSILQITQ